MPGVLLAHSYYLAHDPKQLARMKPYPPLATLYAAAGLRAAGHEVALFDATFASGEQEFEQAVARIRPSVVMLCEDSFNFLVKMCQRGQREAALQMVALARSAGACVVVAGPDASDNPSLYLRAGASAVVLGEADRTIVELCDSLVEQPKAPLDSILGLALSDGDRVRCTPRRPPERDIDQFSMPAWDLVDGQRYREAWLAAHGRFSLNMASSRGCPYHCNWCAKPTWGQSYADRSPAAVAEEMAYLHRTLTPDHIWFADDLFGLRPGWIEALGCELAARKVRIPFTVQSRADRMGEADVAALAHAGCEEVWLGAESGSQRILDAMDKNLRVSEVALARGRLKAAGIRTGLFIQLGYPGEGLDDILATVRMVRETLPDAIGVSVSYPLPNTRFHEMVRPQLGPKTNWDDSGDLAMLYRGAYGSEFYRWLHELLHADLELNQRIAALSGTPDPATARERSRLDAEWADLLSTEQIHRAARPTPLRRIPLRIGSPDLSAAIGYGS